MNSKKPSALIILDGWGNSDHLDYNAIFAAHPSTFNFLWNHYPHALLKASGTAVGLPDGVPGNSEVGHLTLGSGHIVSQPLTIINNALKDNSFFSNAELLRVLEACKHKNGRLHLIGLLSDGYVHSNQEHLYGLIKAAVNCHIPHIFIHPFLDGRDVPPQSALLYLAQLEKVIDELRTETSQSTITIGSLTGRFYAMDRDENWNRTTAVYGMLIGGNPAQTTAREVVQKSYDQRIFDEFVVPTLLEGDARVESNDTLIFFNFRPDRMRQLCSLFCAQPLPSSQHRMSPAIETGPTNVTSATMTEYSPLFGAPFLFQEHKPSRSLLAQLSEKNYSLFAIAETEKYAHVTYFFNGGREVPFENETCVLIPSHKDRSYDKFPEMSAAKITDTLIESLQQDPCDFYLVNYANADMVGHSGNFEKTKEAITILDHELERLYIAFVEERDGTLYITSDHGNAEEMWDFIHQMPKTAHTTNPVPFIMVNRSVYGNTDPLPLTQLADVAPFILKNS